MTLELTEPLAMTLMTRFLNHLELLDTINNNSDENKELSVNYEMINEHADAILRNLLAVGKYFGLNEDIKWIGTEKRERVQGHNDNINKDVEEDISEKSLSNSLNSITKKIYPLAFVVLIDKVGKIGRKAHSVPLISTCLKLYAALLITCPSLTENINNSDYETAYLSILKFIDHVQTFTISRDQVRKREWRSALELAGHLLDRIKTILGENLHSTLNLKLVKSMSAARITRREEKRQMVLMDPDLAAKIKTKENQKKYRARKNKSKNANKKSNNSGSSAHKKRY